MNCKEVVKEYLITNGFDGLTDPAGDCGCDLDSLVCCETGCSDCTPGYKHPHEDVGFVILPYKSSTAIKSKHDLEESKYYEMRTVTEAIDIVQCRTYAEVLIIFSLISGSLTNCHDIHFETTTFKAIKDSSVARRKAIQLKLKNENK